jgi:hypothetical protein
MKLTRNLSPLEPEATLIMRVLVPDTRVPEARKRINTAFSSSSEPLLTNAVGIGDVLFEHVSMSFTSSFKVQATQYSHYHGTHRVSHHGCPAGSAREGLCQTSC